jgi:two-component system response regulator (stage 0 sporulation protein F)
MPELPKVLYVDDEEINLELLQLTFRNDLKVYTAITAEEGFRILSKNQDIRVVISDLKMPVMNGLDFIKEVKSRHEDKVCMLLTAFLESEVMLEGFNKELIFRYLMKPWNKDELYQTILEAYQR